MPHDEGWRVGRHQPRNVYLDGRMVLVVVGADAEAAKLAQAICDAMNAQPKKTRTLFETCSVGRPIDVFGPTSYGHIVTHVDDGSLCEHP
jgi:hypothetical protein